MKSLFEIDETYHGRGPVMCRWQRDGSYVASCGVNGLVEVFDRHGQQVDEVGLSSKTAIVCMDWDKDGEVLAILQENVASIFLYNLQSKRLTTLETNLKNPRFLAWSKTGPQLAVGTGNGTLLLYRKDNLRQETVVGKHSGPITCGAWSETGNLLALGSDDKTVSITSSEGNTEDQFQVKGRPISISFCPKSGSTGPDAESKLQKEWTLGVSIKGEALVLYALRSSPVEMKFQSRYGKLVAYDWLNNSVVVAGFTTGQVAAISTEESKFGFEIFSERLHRTSLTDLVVSKSLSRVASCGDSSVRILNTVKWEEVKSDSISLDREDGQLDSMHWTKDGQILSISTKSGRLYNYLTKMPMVHDVNGVNIAYLSSLREIAIVNALDMQRGIRVTPIKVPVEVEPAFIALGVDHVAVGINNRAWFYHFKENQDPTVTSSLVNEQEYLSSIESLCMNEHFSAALCGGRVYLHKIEAGSPDQGETSMVFPENDGADASCVSLTSHFLIYGTVDGLINLYSLADGTIISGSELRHKGSIRQIFPNSTGTRIIYIDESGSGFLYNPVDTHVLTIPDFSSETSKVLWDGLDPFVFITADPHELSTYVYSPLTINGPVLTKVGPLEVQENGDMITEPLSTQMPPGFVAIASFAGIVTCQTPNSQLSKVMLGSHEALHSMERTEAASRAKFEQSLALRKLQEAWNMALVLESKPHWLALSGRAMEEMNIEMATRVWRKQGDAGMVMALERINFVEDKHILAGNIASLFGDYGQAQELYLESPVPCAALEMRKDLLHWEQALKLAEKVAPEQIPYLSTEYAQQLEFKGEYKQSLEMYQNALEGLKHLRTEKTQEPYLQQYIRSHPEQPGNDEKKKEETEVDDGPLTVRCQQCQAGITRMTLRVGNIPKGVALAVESTDKNLCKECADILVALKQYADAATLYERAGEYEEAASIYIKTKNFAAAQPLLAKVTAPRLHLQFALAKETEKDFRSAVQAYERGKDMDSVARLYLEHLGQPEKAFTIIRKHQSPSGAEMAARYCQSVNDFRGAIEFLLMAKRSTDAFELATSHDTMEVFESALGADGTPEEYSSIARYYETKQQFSKAAEFYAICGQYHKALKLYLQCGELEKATDVVGKARSDMLTHTLIDYLMGETNGVVQDPVHIFRLYMALGNYPQAARTAMVIAHQERESGNYRSALNTLYETHRELEARNIRVPQSLRSSFILLHSYLLVKKRIKVGDYLGAARLLKRVTKSISKFPAHTVPILTSAVITCQRGGLKKTAFDFASRLMRPEHRSELDPNYRRKIEAIVRKRGGSELEDVPEKRSESPYSGDMMPDYELVCPNTKNHVPFCVITGRHMVTHDWCICPNSKMPALYSEYVNYLQNVKNDEDKVDPICGKPITIQELRKVSDPKAYLDAYSAPIDDEEDDNEDDN